MQLIAEAYDLLRHGVGLDVAEIADDLRRLEPGRPRVLPDRDHRQGARPRPTPQTGRPLVDVIVDQAEQKGTGRWTAQDALELGVPLTGITEAVFARSLSALRDQRARRRPACSPGPKPRRARPSRSSTTSAPRSTPRKVVAYAQGFEQMAAAAKTYDWDLRPGRAGDDLARRLHHPRPLPQPHQRGLRRAAGPREPADGAVLPRRRRRRPGRLAQGDRRRRSSRASRSRRSPPRSPTTTATAASAARRT